MPAHVMALDSVTFVAYSALGVSLLALIVIIVVYVILRSAGRVSVPDQGIEISAIVQEFSQRLRRIEERLVDQKVRFDILEIKSKREVGVDRGLSLGVSADSNRVHTRSLERPQQDMIPLELNSDRELSPQGSKPSVAPQRVDIESSSELQNSTEIEALRVVYVGRGIATARDVQSKVGRSREHTARLMNSLFKEGLVVRDPKSRPFSYSITEKGKEFLGVS